MKILVTGASGFVGSTLAEELVRRGHEVTCLVRKTSSLANMENLKFQPIWGDLASPASLDAAVAGAEVVFHVAGLVAAKSRKDFFFANSVCTGNLVEAVKKSGVRHFVYVSSLAAAGPSTPQRKRQEEDESLPVSHYGASKLGGEREVLAVKDHFAVTIVRPPAVYGPRDKGILTFFQAVQSGVLPLLGWKSERLYSFIHVEDLVQGLCLLGLRPNPKSGEIFYLSGEGEYLWDEAMKLIAESLGKKTFPLRLPIPLLKGAAALCSAYTLSSGKVLPFSLDKIKEIEAASWTCSNQKAKQQGFQPYWDLKKGLAQTAFWYRENGWIQSGSTK